MGKTIPRPPKKHEGKAHEAGLKKAIKRRKKGCGSWWITFLPKGSEPSMTRGTVMKGRGRSRKRHVRWSMDHIIYFFPNPAKRCPDYAFMQFVKRETRAVSWNGKRYVDKQKLPAESHGWQPDVEGWEKRQAKHFIDPTELLYRFQKGVKFGKVRGLERRDGPGYSHPVNRPAPKNRRIHYEFRVYVVCNVLKEMKVVGYLEYEFDILIGRNGRPEAIFEKKPIWDNFRITTVCCRKDAEFEKWISRWRVYLLMGLPHDWFRKFDKKKKKKKKGKKKKPGEAPRSLEPAEIRRLVNQSTRTRRSPVKVPKEEPEPPEPEH